MPGALQLSDGEGASGSSRSSLLAKTARRGPELRGCLCLQWLASSGRIHTWGTDLPQARRAGDGNGGDAEELGAATSVAADAPSSRWPEPLPGSGSLH